MTSYINAGCQGYTIYTQKDVVSSATQASYLVPLYSGFLNNSSIHLSQSSAVAALL